MKIKTQSISNLVGEIEVNIVFERLKKIYPNILFIPLVGFDNKLNRLGYGGGYYDRYLSKIKHITKTIKIGVGFSFQKIKKIPINKHDIKLDCVITEKKIIE